MTLLLEPPTRAVTGPEPSARPVWLAAGLAGLASPAIALLLIWAVGLVGWFAADGGGHGTTRSVLRVAADTWLLGHGAHLTVGDATLTATPLGLSLAVLALTYRCGRWAGATSRVPDLRTGLLGTGVLAGVYAATTTTVAVAATVPGAEAALDTTMMGGLLVGALGGGAGLLRGAGVAARLRGWLPTDVLAGGYAVVVTLALMLACGAALTAIAVAVRGVVAANLTEALHLGVVDAGLSLLLLAAVAPNLALLAGGYLLGPGFAVGTGTVVAPGEVALGPVPAFPVVAALPPDGWSPAAMAGVLAVPVVCGVLGMAVAGRVLPATSVLRGALRGAGAGVAGALLLVVAISQAGGAIGPGRMADIGVPVGEAFVAALLLVTPAAVVTGMATTWWARRAGAGTAESEAPSGR